MKVSKNESGNIALAAVAVVVGLVIGFAVAKASNNNNDTNTNNTKASTTQVSTKASDLRSNLVTLGLEHMTLTNIAVDAALDGSKTADSAGAALYANGNDIGAAVGSVYGKSAETTFDSVWKLHLDQFVKYAVADSKNDEAGKKAALDTIATQYTKPLAQYLAKANPNLPEATLESVLGDHVAQTATMIDDHVQGKYADEQNELKLANQHIQGIFSTLAGGIVKQYPSKF
ncbi:MAG: hypothetical protein NVS1B10_02530 [Candidatus Saccharimonadales bacterium]